MNAIGIRAWASSTGRASFEVFGFLNAPKWQNRAIAPDVIMKSFERNVFYLENAAEIQRRINDLKID